MAEFHPLPSLTTSPMNALNKAAEVKAKQCQSAEMPTLDHLAMRDYEHVYEPSDDTFLLLDAILLALEGKLIDVVDEDKSFVTLEIGCGTGVPTVYLAKQLQERIPDGRHVHYVTDVNPEALRIAQETAKHNGIQGEIKPHLGDLLSDLLPEVKETVDILLFNPPYVPTPNDEVGSNGIEASWAGGVHGRVVVDRAICQIAQVLSRVSGQAFLVTVDDNLPDEIAQRFAQVGLLMEPCVRRKARNEFLTIQRLSWISKI